MSTDPQQPEAVVRQYLDDQGGTTRASLHHLLTTFGVDLADESSKGQIEQRLRAAGVVLDRPLAGLAEDDEIALSVEPSESVVAAEGEAESSADASSVPEEPPAVPPSPGDTPPEHQGEAPLRLCRKCSVQTRTFSDRCQNCGASYLRGLGRLSRRAKVLLLAVPLLIVLAAAGIGVALKLRHDN
jgi:hypothetical protein